MATAWTRTLAARVAAYSRWSREDPRPQSARMVAGFKAKFVEEVDPDRVLSEEERQRRAEAALRAHMARLALRSAKARRRKRGPSEGPRRQGGGPHPPARFYRSR